MSKASGSLNNFNNSNVNYKNNIWAAVTITLSFFISLTTQAHDEIAMMAANKAPNKTVVETSVGRVQGLLTDGIITYRGMPYAQAERFMPPRAAVPKSGVLLADHYGSICPQTAKNPFPGAAPELPQSDNCQNLNVWTPSIRDGKKRAVMVWLHGGGFSGGSSMESIAYEGKNLSQKGDVVVVSVNHRLNVMGHLDLSPYGEQYKYSANVGVMDLVASLQWVRKNIRKFGGDANNVTIFGESGGGAKVLTLMATPAAKGLFHKAIVESGAVEIMGMNLTRPEVGQRVTSLTLQALNIQPTELERLKTIPYEQIASASDKALKQTGEEYKLLVPLGGGYGVSWTPTMDSDYIPVQPVGHAFSMQSARIPLLIGTNLNEWETIGNLLNRDTLKSSNKNTWSSTQITEKLKEKYGDKADAVTQAFLKAYPNKKAVDALYVDSFLRIPALKTANLKSDQKTAPVYNYVFTWETPAQGNVGMAYHTAEIPFVFNNIGITKELTGDGQEAFGLAGKMSQAWINFAKTGHPNTKDLPKWKRYTRKNGATMIFDAKPVLKYHHDAQLIKLLAPHGDF